MKKPLAIPAVAIGMYIAMNFVDTLCSNTLPPVCDASEASLWLMETLLLFCSLL